MAHPKSEYKEPYGLIVIYITTVDLEIEVNIK